MRTSRWAMQWEGECLELTYEDLKRLDVSEHQENFDCLELTYEDLKLLPG